MILNLQILNLDATLNSFFDIGSAKFVKGKPLTINMRLLQTDRQLRYVPSELATFSMTLVTSTPNTTVTVNPTFLDQGDRSLLQVTISALETESLIGQNLVLDITDGALEATAIKQLGLQAVKSGDC